MDYLSMSDDELYNYLTNEDDTPKGKVMTEQNTGNSQQVTALPSQQAKETAPSNANFAKLDSLRHRFDTHKQVKKTEMIGGLFARGYTTILAGAPGVGKTLLMEKITHDLSYGGSFLDGFSTLDKPVKSIILAAEFGENALIERAQTFNLHANPDYVEVIDVLNFEQEGISFSLSTKEGRANIEHLAASRPDIIFIDSFGALFEGKENDNSDMRDVFKWLLKIGREYDIAIVVVHHNRKRLSNEQQKPLVLDDIIGGNALQRYVHGVIAIEHRKDYGMNFVTCLKSWGKHFKTFAYKVENDFYGSPSIKIDLEPGEMTEEKLNTKAAKAKSQPSDAEIREEKIKIFLKGKGHQGASIGEIIDALGMDKDKDDNTLKMQLRRLIQDKKLTQPKRGIYTLPAEEIPNYETTQLNIEDSHEQTQS